MAAPIQLGAARLASAAEGPGALAVRPGAEFAANGT